LSYGYKKEELIGKNLLEFIPEKNWPMVSEHVADLAKGKSTQGEVELKTKQGTVMAEFRSSPIKKRGKIVGFQSIIRDITDRKKAEKALKESEQKLRDIIDTSPDAIVWVDTTGKITLVNKKVIEITGFSEKDLIGKNFMDVEALTQESKEKILEGFMKRIEGIDIPPYEVEVVTKNGEIVPAEISASPIFEGDKIVGTQSIFRDLRERKAMEEALRKSEEKFRNIFESANDSMIYLDSSGRILDVNKKTVQLYGGSKRELLEKHFTTLGIFSLGDLPALESIFANILAGGEDTIVLCIKNKKGQEMHLECSASLINTDGEIAGMMVIGRDVTERKKAEEALRRSEEQARRLSEFQNKVIDTADVWIDLLDKEGNVTLWNRAAELISGYSREEVVGHKKIWEWLYPDPKYRAKIFGQAKKIIEKGGRAANDQTTISCKDRTLKTIRWYDNSILDEKGKPVGSLAVGIDITEKKAMEKKLQEYAEHLEEMVEERTGELKESQERLIKSERLAAIGELATMVGHDLRNPLTSLQNACYYMKMKMGASKDEKVKKMFEVVDREVNYANKIINDLLDFSRVKKPELKKVDIISSIQDALTQLKFPENITLTKKFNEIPTIEADPDQLRRVFQNIALNGVQAMPDGGELTVSTRKNGNFVEVAFADTGVGIPEEKMGKLFTPLFTTKAQGVGLGLAICKNLMEGHNGRIEVRSKVGEGSTFTVRLPIHQNEGGEKQV